MEKLASCPDLVAGTISIRSANAESGAGVGLCLAIASAHTGSPTDVSAVMFSEFVVRR
jgi:hypothetical protein